MAISHCHVHTNNKQKETVQHGNMLFPIACYEDHMEEVDVPIHWHEELEYIIVTDGEIDLQVGTSSFTLYNGESIIINAGVLHAVHQVSKTSVLRSLVFHPDLIAGSPTSCFWQELIHPFYSQPNRPYIIMNGHEKWHQEINHYMMQAWQIIVKESEDYPIESRYLISKALKIFINHLPEMPTPQKQDLPTLRRMKILLPYIADHYNEDISNHDLMTQANCSESVLLRSFKKTVGQSPMEYLLQYRIKQAVSLLVTTPKKANEIAITVGFNDISYFTKQFKRMTGMTPLQFRKANT